MSFKVRLLRPLQLPFLPSFSVLVFKQGLPLKHGAWNSLCNPGWTQTCHCPLASAPQVLGLRLEVPHLEDSFHVLLSGPLFNHVHFALYESRFTNLFVLVYVCPEHYWPYKPLDICYGHHKWLLRTEARLWGQWPQRCLAHSHKHRAAVPLPVSLVTWSSICWALGIKMSAFSVCHPKLLSNQNSQLISPTLFPLNFSVALGFEISAPLPC